MKTMKVIYVLVLLAMNTWGQPSEVDQHAAYKRNAAKNKSWLNARVPYTVDPAVDSRLQTVISGAISEMQLQTCVQFAPQSGEFSQVYFTQSAGKQCSAPVGRYGGQQKVVLGTDCQSKAGVLYYLMTSIGFYPEHSRADRDQHVTVQLNNVMSAKQSLFNKETGQTFGQAYDYASIMHWAANAYSSNGQNTLVPKDGNTAKIGVAQGLSAGDIKKIKALYGCAVTTVSPHCCDTKTDCPQLGASFCASAGQFARERCPRTCGACSGSCPTPVKDPCKDEIPDCHEFQRDICFHKDYVYFAKKNCKKWCNLC